MVRIATSEGVIEALPSCGHFMGSAEAPKLFAKACERPGTAWLSDNGVLRVLLLSKEFSKDFGCHVGLGRGHLFFEIWECELW